MRDDLDKNSNITMSMMNMVMLYSNYFQFSLIPTFCIDSDRETEQEAIALIKMQQNKINEYEEIIAESKCFEYQVEVYKQQISNLQSQVLVLEEKIRYSTFDSDNAKISELEARLLRAIEREKSMGTEINTKEQELKYLAERIEEK